MVNGFIVELETQKLGTPLVAGFASTIRFPKRAIGSTLGFVDFFNL